MSAENRERTFSEIGNLMQSSETMRSLGDLIPTPRQKTSSDTGSGTENPWQIGVSHGNGGAVQSNREETQRAFIAAPTEAAASTSLDRLCERLLGSVPAWQREHRFGSDGQAESRIVGVRIAGELTAEAWRVLEPLCTPAGQTAKGAQRVVAEVTRLFAVTPADRTKAGNDELAIDTMALDLAEYPLDCVVRALTVARRGDRWRPSLSKILDDVRWRAERRAALRAAFQEAGLA